MVNVGVVTGAASGMGRACVERMLAVVDVVVATDLRPPVIESTTNMACDVSNRDDVRALADRVAELGTFRALAHAAGLSPTMGDARRVVDVDLLGTVHVLDAFEPLVGPGSAAVCFASSAGYVPLELLGDELARLVHDARAPDFLDRVAALLSDSGLAYAWAKRGVQLEAARAALRWGPRGGRVVSLSPGLIDTPMGRQEFEQQPIMREMLDRIPIHRFGTPDEIAAVVAFLLSDAASYVTGSDVLVDGGQGAAAQLG